MEPAGGKWSSGAAAADVCQQNKLATLHYHVIINAINGLFSLRESVGSAVVSEDCVFMDISAGCMFLTRVPRLEDDLLTARILLHSIIRYPRVSQGWEGKKEVVCKIMNTTEVNNPTSGELPSLDH